VLPDFHLISPIINWRAQQATLREGARPSLVDTVTVVIVESARRPAVALWDLDVTSWASLRHEPCTYKERPPLEPAVGD